MFALSIYIQFMRKAINKPKFITVWDSIDNSKRKSLRLEFMFKTNISLPTFYRRKDNVDYNEIEKEWWALKLNLPKDELFPNN